MVGLAALLLPLLLAFNYWRMAQPPASLGAGDGDLLQTEALAQFERAIALAPSQVDGYRALSALYQDAGQLEDAIAVWEGAAAANPGQTWPLLELGKLYEGAGLAIQARATYYQAAAANPQDLAANRQLAQAAVHVAGEQAIREFLAQREPAVMAADANLTIVNQPMPNGWTFLGYHMTPGAGQTKLRHFWQAPALDVAPTQETQPWEQVAPGIWAGFIETSSLITDGDFEGEAAVTGPQGFPNDLYLASPATRQLRRVVRDQASTTVGALANDIENRNTSFVSNWHSIDPAKAYLVMADVYNVAGNPAVGWRWDGAIADTYKPLDRYGRELGVRDGWRQYAGLAAPPPGATGLQIWLLNTNTPGTAYFDNAAVLPIAPPAPLWPGGKDRATLQAEQWAAQLDAYHRFPGIVHDPAWLANMAEMGPLVRVDQTLSTGWTLQGYAAAESALTSGDSSPLFLFWKGALGEVPGDAVDGWQLLPDGRWLQFLPAARNEAPNAGFETGLAPWDVDLFLAPAETHQLTVTQRSGFTTTAAVLANTPAYSVTGAAGPNIPVASDSVYLHSGWMAGSTGRGYIGVVWQGNIDPTLAPFDDYVAGAQAPLEWHQFAGVYEPPAGASALRIQLLNYLGEGPTLFDDLVLVPVPAPRSAITVTAPAAASNAQNEMVALRYLREYEEDPGLTADESWLLGLASAGPALVLQQEMGEGWIFEGLSADHETLAAGAVGPVFYFWRGPEETVAGSLEDGWYSIGVGQWLQIANLTASLVPNGDLELPPADASSVGFPVDYLRGVVNPDLLQIDERNEMTTTVALLTTTAPTLTTGIASVPLPIKPGEWYVQSAWLRSRAGGSGVLGLSWIMAGADGGGDSASAQIAPDAIYTADDTQNTIWRQYAAVHTPPPTAEGVQVFAYNYLAPGAVAVDNMLLLPLLPPAPFLPAVGKMPAAGRLALAPQP
jgi:tetratricopeptide (TPR) repeat protein